MSGRSVHAAAHPRRGRRVPPRARSRGPSPRRAARRRERRPAARPGRRPRPAGRALRARGGRRRRAPPAAGRPARRGQDDARSRLPGLLPPLTDEAALETTRIHSAAGLGLPPGGLVRQPPFRAPHHGASSVALVGGGSATMRPGEISRGVQRRPVPRRAGRVRAARARRAAPAAGGGGGASGRAAATVTFPARFLLVAAMNPCPCGYGGRPGGCRCTERPGPATSAGCRARCSTGSTCASRSPTVGRRPAGPRPLRADRGRARAGCWRLGPIAAGRGIETNAAIPVDRLDELAPLGTRGAARCSRRRSAAAASPHGACTGCVGWPAPSPTCRARTGARHRRPRRDGAQPASRCRTGDARRRALSA